MKFICIIVCALALTLSINFVNTRQFRKNTGKYRETKERNLAIHADPIKYKNDMYETYDSIVKDINETWQICRQQYYVRGDQIRADMFSNAPTNEVITDVSKRRKCLVDCTWRNMGVVSNRGIFNDAQYRVHIRQLRTKWTYFDTNDRCFYINGNMSTEENFDRCVELIDSYTAAVDDCLYLMDIDSSNLNTCDNTWDMMMCMIQSHRDRLFEAPFYPIYPDVPANRSVTPLHWAFVG